MTANMKTSELRLGNLVQYGGCTAKVCQIEKSFFYCETDGNDFFTRDGEPGAKPITLTEEWLLKFGFKYRRLGLFEAIKVFDSNGYHIYFSQVHLKEIEYVHQLQNLYFALTSEELTIKSE